MIRVVKLTGKYYGVNLGDDDLAEMDAEALQDIQNFINNGEPVILTDDLCSLDDLGIKEKDVIMVE